MGGLGERQARPALTGRPIRNLLVANRGEIAVRIFRTAREMGIRTIAVHSEGDAGAVHLESADRAESLGPGPVSETYLSIPRILEAARRAGADAVHPGYGFLAESAAFARAVEGAGLVWIGPPAEAIEAMGEKLPARALVAARGVPVVPGSAAGVSDDAGLAREAARLGYPVLVKASAGGGGKGMSRVDRAEDLAAAVGEARRIASAAFGDDVVYLEKLLDGARHVEFQVFGDRGGRTVHLFERECSVQRRHQKIVEETPSPALDPALRREMGAAAVEAARAVGYVGAGTVEFLLDRDRRFHFLEMNTRIQVEHPITEETVGVDVVRCQIEVAAGESLPEAWVAGELSQRGHAIELRLYAEDPVDFLPRTGTLLEWIPPEGPGVRVDAGVRRGSAIGLDFDPLLAKLVVHAADRPAAIERARRALDEWVALGVETNRELLAAVLESDEFRSGRYATDLVGRVVQRVATGRSQTPSDAVWIAAALALAGREDAGGGPDEGGRSGAAGPPDPWVERRGWRAGA